MTEELCEGLRLEEHDAGVFELVIDRPARRNALTEEMMARLESFAAELSGREDARVLIVRGDGGAFCAGADLGVVASRGKGDASFRWPETMGREAELLEACEVPVVAVVDGPAVGLGMGLALTCDVCVVEPQAFFAEAHLALGLCPTAMCWWLPRMVGLRRASEIILTGRRVYGEEAVAIGIASQQADAGTGRATALDIAGRIADMPPLMTRFAKYALRVAQDEENMLRVRRFGGAANRMHRLRAALSEPSHDTPEH